MKKENVATGKGEMRAVNEYVVAAGSYVSTTEKEIKEAVADGKVKAETAEKVLKDPQLGTYTVSNNNTPTTLKTPDDYPKYIKEAINKREAALNKTQPHTTTNDTIDFKEKGSALFLLKVTDIVGAHTPNDRFPHPIHDSSTEKNFSIDESGLGHCWRCLVSLNAFQLLVVASGYAPCHEAGTEHISGACIIKGDRGAVWHAWKEAKQRNLIPPTDRIPLSAMWYVAETAGLISPEIQITDRSIMQAKLYKATIKYIEEAL